MASPTLVEQLAAVLPFPIEYIAYLIPFSVGLLVLTILLRKDPAESADSPEDEPVKQESSIDLRKNELFHQLEAKPEATQRSMYRSLRKAQYQSGFTEDDTLTLFLLYQLLFDAHALPFDSFEEISFPELEEDDEVVEEVAEVAEETPAEVAEVQETVHAPEVVREDTPVDMPVADEPIRTAPASSNFSSSFDSGPSDSSSFSSDSGSFGSDSSFD